jgi:hypothetical protein
MNVVQIADEYFPRIAEFHPKDTFPQWIGVDFPGVFAVMRRKHFKGGAVFYIDAPRPRRWIGRRLGASFRRPRWVRPEIKKAA